MDNQLSKQQPTEVGTIKFKDFKEDKPDDELLRFIDGLCFKLSLPALEEQQVIYVAKFLVKEYKWASMKDIDEAILKAKSNKLKGVDGADYNKLSIDFLGRILTAYRPLKGQMKQSNELSIESAGKVLEYDSNNPQIAYNHIKAVFLDERETQGGKHQFPKLMLADWPICYKYLLREGLMIEQTLEDKIEFAEMVREDMLQDLKDSRTDESSIRFKIKTEKATSKYAVASECIRRLTKAWFLTNIDKL